MRLQFPADWLARLRDDARLLADHTADHQHQVEALIELAGWDVRRTEATIANATGGGVNELLNLLFDEMQRSDASAMAARQLRASARRQHALAVRLLACLGGDRCTAEWRQNAVLVADDSGEIRELVALLLEDAGFVVRTAANGLEALIAALEMRPGVIVMDVSMPVLDGIQATSLIKATEATHDARVIAYTGECPVEDGLIPRLFAAVLQKPTTPDVMLATVRHYARA